MKFGKKSVFATAILSVVIVGGMLMVKTNNPTSNMNEERVVKKDIKTYYTYSGEVKAKKEDIVVINNEFKVSEILVKEGQEVDNGDSLLKLSSGSKITSKIDGKVSDVLVNEDVKYDAGTHAVTVTNYDAMQVEININEYDVNDIEVNDKVDVYINAIDKTVEGKVVNLSKNANVVNGVSYFRAVVEIEDTKDVLTGMSTEIKIVKDDVKDVNVISMNAINFDSENQPYVFIKNKDGQLVEKAINIGVNDGENVEIKTGLKDGETIYYPNQIAINPFEMMTNGGK